MPQLLHSAPARTPGVASPQPDAASTGYRRPSRPFAVQAAGAAPARAHRFGDVAVQACGCGRRSAPDDEAVQRKVTADTFKREAWAHGTQRRTVMRAVRQRGADQRAEALRQRRADRAAARRNRAQQRGAKRETRAAGTDRRDQHQQAQRTLRDRQRNRNAARQRMLRQRAVARRRRQMRRYQARRRRQIDQ